jgi:hypothetical protein
MTLAREEQLIMLAARVGPDAAARGRIDELLHTPLDWSYLVRTAVRHGVAPLVAAGLAKAAPEAAGAIPADARAELDRLGEISSARNARMARVLAEILTALGDGGIRPIALKELGLAFEVFPEPGLRPLGDLDLLIRPEEYRRTAEIMRAIGFEPLMTERSSPYTLAYGWGHHFRRAADNVWVDVQWNVLQREWAASAGRRIFDPALLYDGAHPVPLGDAGATEMLVPAPEPALLHLCAHLEGHDYGELILFSDIAEALAAWGSALDWERVAALARRFEARATVYHVLRLAVGTLGAPVPEEALAALSGDTFRGGVHGALFGGLNWLHFSLDDIAVTARPPRSLMLRLEQEVRIEAARGRALYDELDAVIADVREAGAELVVAQGDGVSRRFPDPRLPSFGRIRLVTLEEDREALRAALERRGYDRDGGGAFVREVPVAAEEPLIAGRSRSLMVQMHHGAADALFEGGGEAPSNREVALASIGARLRPSGEAAAGTARIELVAADRETLLAWLLARLGDSEHEALFAIPQVLDVLRLSRRPPNAARTLATARERGVAVAVTRGIEILDGVGLASELPAGLAGARGEPRALEWAREGPGALEREGDLRSAYLLALCLLHARRRELRPLLRSLASGHDARRAPLVTLAAGTLRGLRRAAAPTVAGEPAVYWLEP